MEKYVTSPWSCCKNVGHFQYAIKDIYHSVLSKKKNKKWRTYHSLVNVSLKFQLARLQDESVGSILERQHIYESEEVWTDESFFFSFVSLMNVCMIKLSLKTKHCCALSCYCVSTLTKHNLIHNLIHLYSFIFLLIGLMFFLNSSHFYLQAQCSLLVLIMLNDCKQKAKSYF